VPRAEITVYAGSSLAGPEIGRVQANAGGKWRLDVGSSPVAGADTVSAKSSGGGALLAAPVQRLR
jgi:hypothetical protein